MQPRVDDQLIEDRAWRIPLKIDPAAIGAETDVLGLATEMLGTAHDVRYREVEARRGLRVERTGGAEQCERENAAVMP